MLPVSEQTLRLTAALTAAAAAALLAVPALAQGPGEVAPPGDGRPTVAPAAVPTPHPGLFARTCAAPAKADVMSCHALRRTDVPTRTRAAVTPNALPYGYGPADLRAAYGLPYGGGAGRTVAIVDAYDAPNAEADLAVYRSTYGLPPCTTANGCFLKVNQTGATAPLPAFNAGWAEEIALDVQMVSAVCPDCRILLVEANTSSVTQLGAGVNTAVAMGAKYVSNSYGGAEQAYQLNWDNQFYKHPGVVQAVSTGDNGYGVQFPSSSPYVTAVGGTSLARAGTTFTETAWTGAGSGCSAFEPKPAWQTDPSCAKRAVADVSAVADPSTGVAVYSTEVGGWGLFGGTSASAPIIASVYALAGVPSAGSTPSALPYAHKANLRDVVGGSTGSCAAAYLCNAVAGYDGPTGLGTPTGLGAFTG